MVQIITNNWGWGSWGDVKSNYITYITQQQYDELPDSKLTNGINYFIYNAAGWAIRVLLRDYDNVLHYNNEDELYADLQFENWLTPTSAFPIWISVGNVDSTDGWIQSWVLMNALTTDWHYLRWLYGDDGKLYFDWGLWVFKTIATTDDVTSALWTLRSELSTVAFSWKSSDLDNDAWFNSVPVMTQAEYDNTSWTSSDGKRYMIYTTVN